MEEKNIGQLALDGNDYADQIYQLGALPSGKINPKLIIHSNWANRDALSFSGPDWDTFKEEILSSSGNIQPIKVRPSVRRANASTDPQMYEIVFGHRRHRACMELGLDVFALVEPVTDLDLFEQMDRENRSRVDLSIYEQGEMYRKALDGGLYSSLRKLAEKLNVALSTASDAVNIARLPSDLLNAFESRLDVQRRWSKHLNNALLKDPDSVRAVAKEIIRERRDGKKITSVEAFNRMILRKQMMPLARSVTLSKGGSMIVTIKGKRATFELPELDAARIELVEKAICLTLGG
jgi:ParB family transcriptional regulator, chromosome partitioning protein